MLRTWKKLKLWQKIAVILVAIALIGAVLPQKEKVAASKVTRIYRHSHRTAFIASQEYVKGRLKAPKTADFPFMDYKHSKVDSITYLITSYVDAQNAFGAMLRTDFQVTIQYLGGNDSDVNNWKVIDFKKVGN